MSSELKIGVRERTGPDVGRVHRLGLGRHVIGRDPAGAIQLRDSNVSRQHAILEVSPSGLTVTDLGSKNGVLLKRKQGKTPLTGPTPLVDGAVIDVAGIELEISHPGAQVDEALARVGEPTITRMQGAADEAGRRAGPLVPLVVTVMFAGIVAALLWLG